MATGAKEAGTEGICRLYFHQLVASPYLCLHCMMFNSPPHTTTGNNVKAHTLRRQMELQSSNEIEVMTKYPWLFSILFQQFNSFRVNLQCYQTKLHSITLNFPSQHSQYFNPLPLVAFAPPRPSCSPLALLSARTAAATEFSATPTCRPVWWSCGWCCC